MYVVPTKANPRGYSLTPSTTEPYATCQPQPPETAVCLSISPPRGVPLTYPGGGINGSGWAPPELRDAYKIPATGGAGQTVAIAIAYHYKNAEADLIEYRKKYELPSCTKENNCLEIVNQKGETGNFPAENTGWNTETSLDLDMVSAMCPECHIRLVEANSANPTNLSIAVDTAAKMTGGVGPTSVVSTSWTVQGAGEFSGETSYDTYYNHPGIPITAASGDKAFQTYYPAVSPYVISVGGTALKESSEASRGWTESVWLPSGGGCSVYEPKPAWQTDWQCPMRMDNDTAAQGELGVSIYSGGAWKSSGGTSASSPIVAGILAHASKAVREQQAEAFYRHSLFDTTLGHNESNCANTYLCTAEEGYDGPTGWGTPNGPLEVSAGFGVATEEPTSTTQTGTTLHGYLDPEGAETTYWFEYGQTTAYGRKAPTSPASGGSGTRWKAVSQSLSGLEEDRTYHYRLVASNGTKTVYGQDHRFATAPWTIKETPKPAEETYESTLNDVSCSSSTACTGVGWYEAGSPRAQITLAESWDGSKWTVKTTPNPSTGTKKKLDGVSCESATSCIAVGHYLDNNVEKPFAELMFGGEWYLQTTPAPEGSIDSSLSSVVCMSVSSCTAVGRYALSEGVFGKEYAPLVERLSGSSWSPELIAQPEGAKYTELKGLSCTTGKECIAVGKLTNSSGKAVALHWNGTTWTSQELPSATTLSSVSCSSSTACTAVGAVGTTLTAERWNGKEWSLQSMPEPVASYESPGHGENLELNSVSCPSVSRCVAVGRLEREGEKTTLAEVWNGAEWFVQGAPRPKRGYLYGVACPSDTFCTGVGSQFDAAARPQVLAETASLPASAKPVVETTAATKVTGGTANLTGTVNPGGLPTSYYFEYGLESGKYEYKTSGGSAGFYREVVAESEAISGLKGDTTYHYRIVASNAKGISEGKDQTFKTPVWSLRSFPSPSGAKWTAPRRVSCVSTTDCTAVGDYENSSGARATLAGHWNGSEWSIQSTPSPSGAKWSALADVSCVSSTACTAVGRYENSSNVEVTLAERWNGTEWTVQSTPNPSGAKSSWLEDVSCTSSTACTAVGRYLNSSSVEVTLAERWNGTEWSIQSTPNPSGAKWSRLADVACATATACTAVGSYENSSSVRVTLAETWNGSVWSISTTPNPVGSEWNSLKGVWCGSGSECAAVGSYRVAGEYRALIERLNGAEWSIQTTPEPKRGSLLDVTCLSTIWCEATGTTEGKEPLAEHWDGSKWTIESTSIPPSGSVSVLEGLSCPSTCVSVGYSLEGITPSPLAESR